MEPNIRNLLIVENRLGHLDKLSNFLRAKGFRIIIVNSGGYALNVLDKEDISAVVMETGLPDIDHLNLLKIIRKKFPNIGIIVLSDRGSVEEAVNALKEGASDFLQLPVVNERVMVSLEKIFAQLDLVNKTISLQKQLDSKYGIHNLIGNSKAMQTIYQQIYQVAPSKSTVLIQGESGTGKELIAHSIHNLSDRRNKPFVRLNCGVLAEGVVESELFGHEKGAFTGAVSKRKGRFEIADQGTLFLDEISELSPNVQVKLLRVLEEKEFERVGGSQPITVDVRLLAATNVDLKERVANKTFREDLYYRLNVITIKVPPLRERIEDIPLLVKAFLTQFCKENNKPLMNISRDALDILLSYPWPGNVRELKNTIEGMVIMSTGDTLSAKDIPEHIRRHSAIRDKTNLKVGMTLKEAEKELILATLSETKGNRTHAAKILGIGLRTLYRKLKQYKLEGVKI